MYEVSSNEMLSEGLSGLTEVGVAKSERIGSRECRGAEDTMPFLEGLQGVVLAAQLVGPYGMGHIAWEASIPRTVFSFQVG